MAQGKKKGKSDNIFVECAEVKLDSSWFDGSEPLCCRFHSKGTITEMNVLLQI